MFRWGILGAGGIAGQFASGLSRSMGCELGAVGSRNRDKARRFAALYHGVGCTYEELLDRDDVDAVYVATPKQLA